jgi:3D (Asp-Asp-Asp) domain-containing protein
MVRRRRKHKRGRGLKFFLAVAALAWLLWEGRFYIPKRIRPPQGVAPQVVQMKTTSYCHCRRCCSYKWMLFIPYQKTGTLSYRLKHVGKTSSGALARPGTIAADRSVYPYGTVMYIPGYGYGRVEDTGGAVKGGHIDLYRSNHWFARLWGVQNKPVKVWLPKAKPASSPQQFVPEDPVEPAPETTPEAAAEPQPEQPPDSAPAPATGPGPEPGTAAGMTTNTPPFAAPDEQSARTNSVPSAAVNEG